SVVETGAARSLGIAGQGEERGALGAGELARTLDRTDGVDAAAVALGLLRRLEDAREPLAERLAVLVELEVALLHGPHRGADAVADRDRGALHQPRLDRADGRLLTEANGPLDLADRELDACRDDEVLREAERGPRDLQEPPALLPDRGALLAQAT